MSNFGVLTLSEIERDHVLSVLSRFSPGETCRLLGIGRTTLFRKMMLWSQMSPAEFHKLNSVPVTTTRRMLIAPLTREEHKKAGLQCPLCHCALLDSQAPPD